MTPYRLLFRPDAHADALSARDWYREKSVAIADRFAEDLAGSIASIADNPAKHAVVYRGVRRAMTSHFPYAVYFLVEGDRITILRIVHQAHDPRQWKLLREILTSRGAPNPRTQGCSRGSIVAQESGKEDKAGSAAGDSSSAEDASRPVIPAP